MRAITKGQEPRSLVEHRRNTHSNYSNYADKDGLRAVLVRDQRGLCCYCMKQIEALILNRQFHHNGDKVMEWAMSNVVAKADRKDNVYPNKETNDKKIDPFVALCMAMGRHMAGGEKPDDWSGFLSSPVTG